MRGVKPIDVDLIQARALATGRARELWRPVVPQPQWGGANAAQRGWRWSPPRSRLALPLHEAQECNPYGEPGTHLRVREPWSVRHVGVLPPVADLEPGEGRIVYLADSQDEVHECYASEEMPRWASRFHLEIETVGLRRLHKISPKNIHSTGLVETDQKDSSEITLYTRFISSWNVSWSQQGLDWVANPWCWVLSFSYVDFNRATTEPGFTVPPQERKGGEDEPMSHTHEHGVQG